MILCFHWLLIVHQVPGIVQCGRATMVNKTGKSLVATYFMFVQAFGKQMGNKDTKKFFKKHNSRMERCKGNENSSFIRKDYGGKTLLREPQRPL